MAFLKETERSLRLYFIVVGVIGTLLALSNLSDASKLPAGLPFIVVLGVWPAAIAHVVLSPCFILAGITLGSALEQGAPRTRALVKVSALVLVVEAVLYGAAMSHLQGAQNGSELMGRAVGHAVIPLLILWYIHSNLKRLADESQRRVVDTIGRKFS